MSQIQMMFKIFKWLIAIFVKGLYGTAEYSFKLAHGFLDDEDAPEHGKGKARKYFHFVV